ncbi:MAG: hypothetical protein GY782_04905 [Gammaproteobacteria bacterium]|nr:hypothetical protein [Gammaproteobacteria bacterium]
MITKEQEENLKYIFNHFGEKVQVQKLQEEIEEYLNSFDFDNEIEELADIYVVLTQLIKFAEFGDLIKDKIDYKINRTIERIESGYYE